MKKHETKAEKTARARRESSMRPGRDLPASAPSALKGRRVAQAKWRELMRVYGELEGEIVTRLDMDLLLQYCILAEQLTQIDRLRKNAFDLWEQFEQRRDDLLQEGDVEEAAIYGSRALDAYDAITKLDARADRKRSLVFRLQQNLYMTPRARAGTAPAKSPEPEAPSEMDQLLGEVTDFVNGRGE